MMYLEELEQKVLRLIGKNQELQTQLSAAAKENELLKEQHKQYEATLLKEASTAAALIKEKEALASGIEGLLNSINALEKTH